MKSKYMFFIFSVFLFMISLVIVYEKQSEIREKKPGINSMVYFIENVGQVEGSIKYYEKGPKRSMYFTEEGVYISIGKELIKLKAVNSYKGKIRGEEKLSGVVNYFIGNDPKKWYRGINTFREVKYEGIYEGVDVVFYRKGSDIEYDVVVDREVDVSKIEFEYEGVKRIGVDDRGDLVIELVSGDKIVQRKPYVYQEVRGKKVEIEGRYEVRENRFSFCIREYDKEYALVIDPVLEFSTYLGGMNFDNGNEVAIDGSGNIVVVGNTSSTDFPTQNAYDNTHNGSDDVFIKNLACHYSV